MSKARDFAAQYGPRIPDEERPAFQAAMAPDQTYDAFGRFPLKGEQGLADMEKYGLVFEKRKER